MVSSLFARAASASAGLSAALDESVYAPAAARRAPQIRRTQAAETAALQAPPLRSSSFRDGAAATRVVAASAAEGGTAAAAAPWDARFAGPIPHTPLYYAKCMLGGALACGLTHTAVTPLDVAKCNAQVNPAKYKGPVSGMRLIVAEEGAAAVWKGWLPTLLGYSMQGLFKFGLYEFFKDFYSTQVGEEKAKQYRGLIWCAGSASAEFFADIALCPMEMVKVKVQTSPHGTWPVAFGPAMAKMNMERAETRFPFGSVVPLWSRQIPYTVAKFFFFEKVVSLFYTHVFTNPKDTYSKGTQLGYVPPPSLHLLPPPTYLRNLVES
jgi:solute carrier family 25 (mitochondrial phosphate transporter), member 3